MQEVGDSLASIEQELAAVKSETNDSFSRVSTDVDNTGTLVAPHSGDLILTLQCLYKAYLPVVLDVSSSLLSGHPRVRAMMKDSFRLN